MQYLLNFIDFSEPEIQVVFDGFMNSLIAGKEYQVGVSAVNLAGESVITSDFIIVGEQPTPPINLKIENVVPNSVIRISWESGLYSGGIPV